MEDKQESAAAVDSSIDVLDPQKVQEALSPEPANIDPEAKYVADLPAEERLIGLKLLPSLRAAVSQGNEARVARRLQDLQIDFEKKAQEAINGELQKIRDANKPPDPQQLEKLLNQEYLEFKLKIKGHEQEFVISELTQDLEVKFIKAITKKIMPYVKEISSVEWQTGKYDDRLKRIVEIVPEGLDILADLASLSLDHTQKTVTSQWVKENLSSVRIMRIVEAQIEAGRIRDFFSLACRLLPSGTIG